jgi:glycopeptide antibiotics resistance protein
VVGVSSRVRWHAAATVGLACYLVALAWIVFAPAPEASQFTGIVAVVARWIEDAGLASFEPAYAVLEFVANIVLFVPFGMLWMLAPPAARPLAVIGLGLATSIVIELVQLALPTRYSTVSDVIANTVGAAVGAWLVVMLTRPPESRR